MDTIHVEEIYEQHIKPLSPAERLRLVEMTARDLAEAPTQIADKPKRNIMELRGLGAEIWQGIDAQEYVNSLRGEWEPQP